MTPTPPPKPTLRQAFLLLLLSLALLVPLPSPAQDPKPGAEERASEPERPGFLEAQGIAPAEEVPTEEAPAETAPEPMAPRFASWLKEVEPLITGAERQLFESLRRNYQRDAFIQQFWKVRDPFPQTARNELKERWPLRLAEARNRYETLSDDRSRVLLVHGEPRAKLEVRCTKTRVPAEVWAYEGSDQVRFSFAIVFLRRGGQGEARIWRPTTSGISLDQTIARARACVNGSQLAQIVSTLRANADRYERDLARVLAKPRPRSTEWILAFTANTTDLGAADEPLAAEFELAFPGRHQSRTVVQALLLVPTAEAGEGEYAGYRSYDFQLTGEVVIGDSLFEGFRYKFGLPAEEATEVIPLAFQRFLRPGTYKLVLKLDDLNSRKAFRREMEIEVPAVDEVIELPTFHDPETAQLFAEATAAIEAGETDLKLIPPHGELHKGFVRFDTLVSGSEIEKVQFFLDTKLVLTKNRPPFEVRIDLGPYPDLHTLRAVGLDGEGREIAGDEILLNAGGYRFVVKLIEPRRGVTYENSLRARAEVEVPEGRSLDRLEIYLNESLVATLYQEPFVQPIVLPKTEEIAYVRAVAYLPDGNSTEDIAFINAPDYLEEVEVQFVELYTSALDRQGRPVEGLVESDFTVFEDGEEQTITRFDRVENLPIHVGILIDNSASMVGTLEEVRRAALSFFQQAVTPRDRAAVITFNNFPNLAVKLTNDRQQLGSGLAGLVAEGKTALYDSLMFGLYYFTGIKGQRALLVLSDGKDEASRFDFEETLEYARRAGITLYSIGLRLTDASARAKLGRLADETGGRSFFINNIEDLGEIYGQIQRELRSQYLIAYQSSNIDDSGEFRTIVLETSKPGITVKTLSGYYP